MIFERFIAAMLLLGSVLALSQFPARPASAQDQKAADEQRPLLLQQLAQHLSGRRREDALEVAERLIRLAEEKHGAKPYSVAGEIGWLGSDFQKAGMNADAEALYKRGLAIEEADTGPNPFSLRRLADFYAERGRLDEAAQANQRVLTITVRHTPVPSKHHFYPLVSTTFVRLREIYLEQQRYDDLEALYREESTWVEAVAGPDTIDAAEPLGRLAGVYFLQKRFAEAERLYQRTLKIYARGQAEKKMDHRYAPLARDCNGLGMVYLAQRRYREAEPLFLRAVRGREATVFWDGPSPLGYSFMNLAQVYKAQRRFAKAVDPYESALRLLETFLPQDHPDLAKVLADLPAVYRALGRRADADKVHSEHLARVRALQERLKR